MIFFQCFGLNCPGKTRPFQKNCHIFSGRSCQNTIHTKLFSPIFQSKIRSLNCMGSYMLGENVVREINRKQSTDRLCWIVFFMIKHWFVQCVCVCFSLMVKVNWWFLLIHNTYIVCNIIIFTNFFSSSIFMDKQAFQPVSFFVLIGMQIISIIVQIFIWII